MNSSFVAKRGGGSLFKKAMRTASLVFALNLLPATMHAQSTADAGVGQPIGQPVVVTTPERDRLRAPDIRDAIVQAAANALITPAAPAETRPRNLEEERSTGEAEAPAETPRTQARRRPHTFDLDAGRIRALDLSAFSPIYASVGFTRSAMPRLFLESNIPGAEVQVPGLEVNSASVYGGVSAIRSGSIGLGATGRIARSFTLHVADNYNLAKVDENELVFFGRINVGLGDLFLFIEPHMGFRSGSAVFSTVNLSNGMESRTGKDFSKAILGARLGVAVPHTFVLAINRSTDPYSLFSGEMALNISDVFELEFSNEWQRILATVGSENAHFSAEAKRVVTRALAELWVLSSRNERFGLALNGGFTDERILPTYLHNDELGTRALLGVSAKLFGISLAADYTGNFHGDFRAMLRADVLWAGSDAVLSASGSMLTPGVGQSAFSEGGRVNLAFPR